VHFTIPPCVIYSHPLKKKNVSHIKPAAPAAATIDVAQSTVLARDRRWRFQARNWRGQDKAAGRAEQERKIQHYQFKRDIDVLYLHSFILLYLHSFILLYLHSFILLYLHSFAVITGRVVRILCDQQAEALCSCCVFDCEPPEI